MVDTRRYGERAILLTLADGDEALAWYEDLRAEPLAGTVDIVLGARTVLVMLTGSGAAQTATAVVQGRAPEPVPTAKGTVIEIPVRYDGADLGEVAAHSGLTVAEVVSQHSAAQYRVAFVGFAPGFAYLAGLPPALQCPRRLSPRARVPTGSVAIAGEYAAVYPRESPGGWNLIGSTDLAIWDPGRQPPAVLQPGMRVRFVDTT